MYLDYFFLGKIQRKAGELTLGVLTPGGFFKCLFMAVSGDKTSMPPEARQVI